MAPNRSSLPSPAALAVLLLCFLSSIAAASTPADPSPSIPSPAKPSPTKPSPTPPSPTGPSQATPTILDVSDRYRYQGCYNETTGVSGSGGARALDNGANEVLPGKMTVPLCLGFCAGGGKDGTVYKYAGLEYSRECWCAQRLSAISARLDDGECNLGCDGDEGTACGGALKLSVYMVSAAASTGIAYGLATAVVLANVVLFNIL